MASRGAIERLDPHRRAPNRAPPRAPAQCPESLEPHARRHWMSISHPHRPLPRPPQCAADRRVRRNAPAQLNGRGRGGARAKGSRQLRARTGTPAASDATRARATIVSTSVCPPRHITTRLSIGARAATRGRGATERSAEHTGATTSYPSSSSFVAAAKPHFPRDGMSVSRPHPAAIVAHHDAPLIGERAATRRASQWKMVMHINVRRSRNRRAISVCGSRGVGIVSRRDPCSPCTGPPRPPRSGTHSPSIPPDSVSRGVPVAVLEALLLVCWALYSSKHPPQHCYVALSGPVPVARPAGHGRLSSQRT
jgi:hypothetical protein